MRSALLTALLVFTFTQTVVAKEFPAQARLFVGGITVNPENANQTIVGAGLKKLESATQYGVEITYPALTYLEVGMRYAKHMGYQEEDPANPATDYSVKLDQDSVMLLARVPFFKSGIVRVDGFAGFGGSNTNLTIKTATQNGDLTKKADGGWFASPYSAFGASVAVGYKGFYLVFEGGMESNKIDGLSYSGSGTNSINEIDLSGSFFSVGLLIDGITAFTK